VLYVIIVIGVNVIDDDLFYDDDHGDRNEYCIIECYRIYMYHLQVDANLTALIEPKVSPLVIAIFLKYSGGTVYFVDYCSSFR